MCIGKHGMDKVQNQLRFQATMGDLEHGPHKEEYAYSPRVELSKLCALVLCSVPLITEKKQRVCLLISIETLSLKSRACAGNLYSRR